MDTLVRSTDRRFAGVARLFGDAAAARVLAAHVVVVGVGGVGSWAAEALARSGVGMLTLIDLDHVAESNINRQVHALGSTLGMAKVDAMRARIADIAPDCVVNPVDAFVTRDDVAALIPADADFVIDAIDAVSAKAALIVHCRTAGIPMVSCGAAGGRSDPLKLREGDLAHTDGDALLAAVRSRLRQRHGFPRGKPNKCPAFGVTVIHSEERAVQAPPVCEDGLMGGAPLACAGYGSIVTVTAPMGMAAAAVAMRGIAAGTAGR